MLHDSSLCISTTDLFIQLHALYTTSVIHFSYIHQLLTQTPCNLVWQTLVHQCLICCLYCVHGVARSRNFSRKIVEACGTGHLEDAVMATKTKSYTLVSKLVLLTFRECVPGGLDLSLTSTAETFASTSPYIVRSSYRGIGFMFRIAVILALFCVSSIS